MAKGKLSIQEKYAIQAMLHEGKDVKEIQNILERPKSRAVQIYVKEELNKLHDTVAKIQSEQETQPENKFKAKVSEEIRIETIHKLIKDGMEREDAEHLVNVTAKELTHDPDNGQQLYVYCIQHRTALAKNFMVTKTQGQGKDGVAIMTYPASSRGDESSKRSRGQHSRTSKGAVWQPKQGKIRGENQDR